MKKGVIVYLTDSAGLPEDFDAAEALAALTIQCEYSVLAASTDGFYDVPEAWHLMLTRGIQHISCVKGHLNVAGRIELYGEPLRLYG
jgi:hypothetical protein